MQGRRKRFRPILDADMARRGCLAAGNHVYFIDEEEGGREGPPAT